jgi:hypothetical protein
MTMIWISGLVEGGPEPFGFMLLFVMFVVFVVLLLHGLDRTVDLYYVELMLSVPCIRTLLMTITGYDWKRIINWTLI